MLNQPLGHLSDLKIDWKNYEPFLNKIAAPAKSRLLNEGEISDKIFIIQSGSVRLGYLQDEKDITFQFFFENELFTSVESFFCDKPSRFFIETVEPINAFYLTKNMLDLLIEKKPEMEEISQQIMLNGLVFYSSQLLSYMQDTPQKRYNNLINTRPYIFMRVPQRHIASYLGITDVSLSRIKSRR
jgi:CRP-like cAMP-binding protein